MIGFHKHAARWWYVGIERLEGTTYVHVGYWFVSFRNRRGVKKG